MRPRHLQRTWKFRTATSPPTLRLLPLFFFLPLPGRAFSFAAPSLCSWHTLVRKPSRLRQGSLGIKIHPCNDVTLLMYLVDFKVRRSFGGLPATAQLFLKDHEEVRRPVVYRVIRNRKARGAVAL
jgi:hypothetical protein